LSGVPDDDLVFRSEAPGAALLEGWSDAGTWRILLPWPEETRALPWSRAHEWQSFLREIEGHSPLLALPESQSPFLGGWVGFLAYEIAAPLIADPPPEPPAFFARHRAGVTIDPAGNAFLFAPDGSEEHFARLLDTSRAETPHFVPPRGPVHDSLGDGAYAAAVERIREAIRDGDVYQVNLTRSFSVDTSCDPAALYRALTAPRAPRSSAFIRGDGWTIVSASPEVLLSFDRRTGVADSRPIKGTVRRAGDDDAEIEALLASKKDASEHLMIVDVVRNDFGKVAPPGRVCVPAFRTVRTLEHLHHLESTVRAEGLQDCTLSDIAEALLPAASITGAPKRAAVQMIRDIEPAPRGVYCGSIGYLDARGHAELSVAIRTAVVTDHSVRYHAGGGIVWDSNAAAEDAECRVKSEAFFRYLEEKA